MGRVGNADTHAPPNATRISVIQVIRERSHENNHHGFTCKHPVKNSVRQCGPTSEDPDSAAVARPSPHGAPTGIAGTGAPFLW
jgi:hypothetical protein